MHQNTKFHTYKNKESQFWNIKDNQETLRQILDCDKVFINEITTESDKHLGCDAVAKKRYSNSIISQSVSLRIRYDNRFTDLNFRNHLSNHNSELSKILAMVEYQSNYAKYFVQCFDVTNNKAKFCVKWRTDDIALFVYGKLQDLDVYYKTSTNRYDFPLSEAVQYNAVCYDLSGQELKSVNYQYIIENYR